MKKIKEWFEKHKKELVVGAVAAGGTALYFIAKEKRFGLQAGVRFTLRFLEGCDEDKFGWNDNREVYTSVNLNKPEFSISDCGKLGELILEKLPQITETTALDHVSANYTSYRKGVE